MTEIVSSQKNAPRNDRTGCVCGQTLIRKKYGLSQEKFANLPGISVSTLRNWEQGRRKSEGPARVLLYIAASNSEAIPGVANNSI